MSKLTDPVRDLRRCRTCGLDTIEAEEIKAHEIDCAALAEEALLENAQEAAEANAKWELEAEDKWVDEQIQRRGESKGHNYGR